MYISHLQLKGFKSFGGVHDLPLSPGMTAIVGPNGSGKSNLLDALRWVLGDSHASKLRISRQGDLLFQGSSSNPKAKEAEVAIQLREDNRLCTIRRKVSADGVTQAIVDNVRKNLTELEEVKRNWRLEGDRFAFIGQGEVAEVIQQRPSARRMQLEALFGIDLYRKRRMDAADRLDETQKEFDRLRNFAAELSTRRELIAPDVQRASQVKQLVDQLDEYRRQLYYARRAQSERRLIDFDKELERLELLKQRCAFWARAWNLHVDFHESKVSSFGQKRQNQERELADLHSQLQNLTRQGYTNATTLLSAKRRKEQLIEERKEHDERIEKLKVDRLKTQESLSECSKQLESQKAQLEAKDVVWKKQEQERLQHRAEWEALNREKGEVEADFQQLKAKLSALGRSLQQFNMGDQGREHAERGKKIKKEQEQIEKRHMELLDCQEVTANKYQDCYARLQQLTSDLNRKKREHSQLASKLNDVSDQVQAEIYPKPVQHVLSATKLGRLKANPIAVIDAFSCPHHIASALEAYLGARQYWLLVEDMEEAGRCIDQLKVSAMGRATFLPLERCKSRRPDMGFPLPDKTVGWGMKLITPQSKWIAALEHIMGDLLIVDGYHVGQSLLRQGFRCPVVTLDGDVFQPAGSISGGKSQKSGRAIELKALLSKLEQDVQFARNEIETLTKQYAKAEKEEENASAEKEELALELRRLSEQRSELNAAWESHTREKERARGEKESVIRSLQEGGKKYLELKHQLVTLTHASEYQEGVEDLSLFMEIESLKGDIALSDERTRSNFALLDRIVSELRIQETERESLEEEFLSLENEEIHNKSALSRMGRRYAELHQRRQILCKEMRDFEERHVHFIRLREKRQKRFNFAETRSTQSENEVFLRQQKKEEQIRELNELVSTWEEQYPYPGEYPLETDVEELRKVTRDLERNVRSLGDVDMGVLSEDKNLEERLLFLGEQLDDVRQGMQDLQKLIDEADMQAKAVFTEALQEIDKRFNDLFQHLFGGGEAHLEMVEGDALWNSGVDVIARPPGKHPQSIAQLSGGEQSLSAVALLFASLEVAGCPIAVLDEVDAALDEVNLRRFADLARANATNKQIFVMTHRRVTMERADVLYGVTLSEPGLSQVIGVRVEDWA